MKRLAFLLLICIVTLNAYALNLFSHNELKKYEKQLNALDSLLKEKDVFVAAKKERILQLKKQKGKAQTNAELYMMNKLIYGEYRLYNADSALYYLEKNKELARQTNNKEWMITSQLEQSFVLMSTGLLKEALDIVHGIQVSNLSRSLRSKYYGQMRALYSRLRDYSNGNSKLWHKYDDLQRIYRDSVCVTATPDESRYLNNMVWKYIGTPEVAHFKYILEQKIASFSPDTRYYVVMAYNLASIYKYEGNENKYLQYLILSAMADIRTVNGDISSLQELAEYLFSHGDIDRAHTYVNYYSQNAQTYQNRVRFISASNLQKAIQQAYQERNRRQQQRLSIFLIIVSILSVVLIGAFLFIRRQMRRLAESRRKLDEVNKLLNKHMQNLSDAHRRLEETNAQLKDLNDKLKEVNVELFEANDTKEKYIAYVFNICSTYISKLEEYRKNINRKLRVGQIEDARMLTDSSAMETNELKEFYQNFDKIVLNLYPDFVKNFNSLLLPEERIELKDGELLNTELRIHALVRLGITDSGKIADFLHCSPQTIYNSRFKTRNKATIPKEEFMHAIKGIGKHKI
ncbi:DUF6377 domain-containing protein [uncultured Bacteroides sp.]|uniref:DUF6377 domain-containing protein n=1 Tax=uncultured Bacteroides sp. TaxID=162156 RepID=UPI002AA9580E|nr:DUF6377 domain-containing protein [uncultured Bacteroides sp.]